METASFRLSMLDDPVFLQFTKTLEEQKLGDPVTPLFKAGEDFTNCEILHRRAGRAKKLKLPKDEYYEQMAMVHNAQGLRRLRNAKASMKKAIEMLPPGLEKKVSEKEMKEVLDENEMMLKNELFEKDLSPEEAEEVWTHYGKARKALDDKGPRGLMEHVGSKIDELTEARTDPAKGRQHGSAILAWKAILIASILGVGLLAVVACFVWAECDWALIALTTCAVAALVILACGC